MTPEEIRKMPLEELLSCGAFACGCGKTHGTGTRHVRIGRGAVAALPEYLAELGSRKPFLLSGHDTFAAAGETVCRTLESAGIPYARYVFPVSPVLPTEASVGSAVMHFDPSCDAIVGIGSGVINDIGKLLAHLTGKPYLIVGTAPSMDGYASATSSMERDGLKVSLDSAAPWAIIGDLDILCRAPMRMLLSGVGDMLTKYVSLTEWKLAHLIVGEYYCPVVAALVENALEKVVTAAPRLAQREEDAVRAVMEGLVIAGLAMGYAGVSRPASGMEHYFSHLWDMRSLAFPEAKHDLHGIQAGIGTLLTLRVYEYLRTVKPDREKALRYAESFDPEAWNDALTEFVGPGAAAMIEGERRERKYDRQKHAARLEVILANWEEILRLIGELPSPEFLCEKMTAIGEPTDALLFGTPEQIRTAMCMTKDIRDKYVGSRLLWDLGELEEAAANLAV